MLLQMRPSSYGILIKINKCMNHQFSKNITDFCFLPAYHKFAYHQISHCPNEKHDNISLKSFFIGTMQDLVINKFVLIYTDTDTKILNNS